MSYDINFWNQERALELSAQEIYERLSDGADVDGLASLPLDAINTRLQEHFSDFDPSDDFPMISLDDGSIEFLGSRQCYRFDFRGDVKAKDKNAIVRIMADYECPMYDPQIGQRYDTGDGTGLGELPVFEDPTPEQVAEMERIKSEFMSQLDSSNDKKGCISVSVGVLCFAAGLAALAYRALST